MVITYRKHFLQIPDIIEKDHNAVVQPFFIKSHFEFDHFCNSRFNSATKNILVRLQNTFASAVNKNSLLPKYIAVVLDEDIIDYLGYQDTGMSQIIGGMLHWILKQFKEIIQKRKDQLPVKSKRDTEPCVYWCLAPLHVNFSDKKNEARKKWNFCLESLLKGHSDMRVIKLKEVWNFNDKSLIAMNRFTDTGFYTYWRAVDPALKFNILRHELFLTKTKLWKDEEKRRDIIPTTEAVKPVAFWVNKPLLDTRNVECSF